MPRGVSSERDLTAVRARRKDQGAVSRYTFEEVHETRVPETGHTPLLPVKEEVVDLIMENGWASGIKVGTRSDLARPLLVDMDPMVDPVLFWSGKRSKRAIPVLPLQRNEVVSESKIGQVVEAAKEATLKKEGQKRLSAYFAELEKSLRESDRDRRVEFYTHDGGWKNKLVCGDSLVVMESLLRYEGLRGQVQTIFMDPPYGVSYNSNFQQRVDSAENVEEEGKDDVVTIKAFRDTWTLGVHSYLSYLQERLYLMRELLAETGSVFVQISEENVHRVRLLMDEVFGAENCCGQIAFRRTGTSTKDLIEVVADYFLWYAKNKSTVTYHPLYQDRERVLDGYQGLMRESRDGKTEALSPSEIEDPRLTPDGWRVYVTQPITSQHPSETRGFTYEFNGDKFAPSEGRQWSVSKEGMDRLAQLGRLVKHGKTLRVKYYPFEDSPVTPLKSIWLDTPLGGFRREKLYVVQTPTKAVQRCILMTSDPGDLVFDPTCGSGTTAYCAERYGRRWITCDTSRVAINIARQRLMSAAFDHFKLRGKGVSDGFEYATAKKSSASTLAYDMEPESIKLVDRPEIVKGVVRVTGPFELLTVGRYSVEDWKGSFNEGGTLENYITVICRLYRKDAAPQTSKGLIHAVVESQKGKFAISVGPVSGRVTAKQLNDAAQDALASGLPEVHILGWAFEANVGEIKSKLEAQGKVKINLVVIRPDTLMEGLKTDQPGMLFSPLSLPDIRLNPKESGASSKEFTISLEGVGVFDREKRITDYKNADSGYVAAWYLDEDYDGDCFVDCQMFFDFKRVPNLSSVLSNDPDSEDFELKLESAPFSPGKYGRIAIKVVDVYGNESTVVKSLPNS